jgi:hypothetical protein
MQSAANPMIKGMVMNQTPEQMTRDTIDRQLRLPAAN